MANRVVKQTELLHYYEDSCSCNPTPMTTAEVDKAKAISELSADELMRLINRLRNERDAEDIIRSLRRSAGEIDTYENPAKIDTKTPVEQLYHHGILGQHWGVRRFQNEDGTRTPAGKKRDITNDVASSEDHLKSRESQKKTPEGLSNDELRKLNERLQLETTYKNLTTEKTQIADSFVKKAIKDAGGQALTEFSKGVFLGAAKTLVKELSPTFAETAFSIKPKKKE